MKNKSFFRKIYTFAIRKSDCINECNYIVAKLTKYKNNVSADSKQSLRGINTPSERERLKNNVPTEIEK